MKHYYIGRESRVTLNCKFALASELLNLQDMEIEWNIVPRNREEDDKIIIWLTGGIIYNNLYNPLKGRVHFTSPDPQNGDASLTITDLKLTDTGTYQCKVKKLNELDIKNIILNIMERPSKPICYMEGEAVADKDVILKCRSSQGTPPLKYRWAKTSGNQMLPCNAFVDTIEGDLYLGKTTENDCGTYLCTVESLVGMENCEITLNFTPPQTMSYGYEYTAAAVVTVAVVIVAVICYCRRKKNEEEFSNELEYELPLSRWRSTTVSWPLERAQGSAQVRKSSAKNVLHVRVCWYLCHKFNNSRFNSLL